MIKIPKYFKYNVSVIVQMAAILTNKRADTISIIDKNKCFCIPNFGEQKIIHPFFTTLSQHLTELGLSITFDIVKYNNDNFILESNESQSHFIYF